MTGAVIPEVPGIACYDIVVDGADGGIEAGIERNASLQSGIAYMMTGAASWMKPSFRKVCVQPLALLTVRLTSKVSMRVY